jgi:hypothetical protein
MAQAFYLASFEKQLTGSALAGSNCGAASGAMLTDQMTLGLKNPTPDQFRYRTGDYSGGLFIATVGRTMELEYGAPNTVYDASDGLDWYELRTRLLRGQFAVVNGDYDQIPMYLRGSRTFTGFHSVVYHQFNSDRSKVRVGDPLNDGRLAGHPKGWVWWPAEVARNYVEKYDREVPGDGLHACVMDLRRLRARPVSPNTQIRASASRTSVSIGSFGGSQTVVWGGTVKGEAIANNTVWYRVWCPSAARIGYCHSSVVTRV